MPEMSRPFPAKAFKDWRERMGLNTRDAPEALGISRQRLFDIEQHGAPLYIALACQALARGLRPFEEGDPIARDVLRKSKDGA